MMSYSCSPWSSNLSYCRSWEEGRFRSEKKDEDDSKDK